MMSATRYAVVFQHILSYYVASNVAPDQWDGPFATKEAALLAARQSQADQSADPSFVLDLTNAKPDELKAYLR